MPDELYRMSAVDIARNIRNGKLQLRETVEYFLNRIRTYNEKFGVFISLVESINTRENAPFPVPYALKDNILALGTRTTCGSRILENYHSPYDATVTMRLKEAGAVLLGKTNMDEFAMGSTTEFSAFFVTRNPWNIEKVPGGSSGGSAVAVATGMVPFALGSDTGGSIRLPASFCGVVGFKPTYGLVSRYGLVAFGSSLDQIGPIAKTVEDCAFVTSIIAGYDPKDSTTSKKRVDFLNGLNDNIRGVRVAYPRNLLEYEALDADVRDAFFESLKMLEKAGCEVKPVEMPLLEKSVAVYYIIAPGEASSNLARYDGMRYGLRVQEEGLDATYHGTREIGFGEEVKRRILMGTFTLSATYYEAYYDKALKVRRLIANELNNVLSENDLIMLPTSPVKPHNIGEVQSPLTYYLMDIYTIPANLAGLPAVSVPVCLSDGLPVGVQFMGKRYSDPLVLRVAHNFEKMRGEFPLPKI